MVPNAAIAEPGSPSAALFLANGALFANLVPRFPEIKADLGLSNTGFGLSVAAFSAGALLSGLTAGVLIRRFGSAVVAVASSLLLAVFTLVAGVGTDGRRCSRRALFVAGAADAVTDVAQNAHGLRVQRDYGRSIINSLHATWSVGAILGGLIGAAAIALHVAARRAAGGVGGWCSRASCLAGSRLPAARSRPAPNPPQPHPPAGRVRRTAATCVTLAVLALLAIAGAFVEDAGSSWATLYLRDSLGAPGRGRGRSASWPWSASSSSAGCSATGWSTGSRRARWSRGGRAADRGRDGRRAGVSERRRAPSPGSPWPGSASATVVPAAFHGADNVPGLRPVPG